MTLFDLITVLILAASGAIGFARGAAREVITVISFIIAVAFSVFSLRVSAPIARHSIHPDVLANAVAILVVFAVVYGLLRWGGASLTRGIHSAEALGMLDRVIGVGFGLVRGLVLLGVFFLVFSQATPAERVPGWIKNAAFFPLSAASGHMLMALAPQGAAVANKVGPALENAVRDGSPDGASKPAASPGPGYDEKSRAGVDALVEKTR